jgi:hypothetical protein
MTGEVLRKAGIQYWITPGQRTPANAPTDYPVLDTAHPEYISRHPTTREQSNANQASV